MDDDSSMKVQKNFICDHCYGAFRSSYHLKRHILTHTGESSELNRSLSLPLMTFSVYDFTVAPVLVQWMYFSEESVSLLITWREKMCQGLVNADK